MLKNKKSPHTEEEEDIENKKVVFMLTTETVSNPLLFLS
ncbi:hypothetical protein SBF1_1330002 [Candidatus Desulfosporosinus infrequens]|uniref:Uncharacterized protein n=1 Tax=Candidatus Desulfosporosinus infrequens TaxID=2043169 RepID=A0A2U3K4E5_9FIRM|nr:hypothetical protein SBF1_1330002 [Candidatus Desulfosporosinus infrequens]